MISETSPTSTARISTNARAPTTTAPDARAEFTALLDAALPRAYAAARYMTRNRADAEDLVQEASLRAWKGFAGFEPGTNFPAWFMRILTNAFYNRHRRERRTPDTVPLDDTPDLYLYGKTAAAGLHAGDEDPARTFLTKLDAEQVQDAIGSLPDEYRTAAALYFVDEFSYQEIADALGCPVGTVRSRLHRGRKILQVALWRLAQEHGIVPKDDDASRIDHEQLRGASDR